MKKIIFLLFTLLLSVTMFAQNMQTLQEATQVVTVDEGVMPAREVATPPAATLQRMAPEGTPKPTIVTPPQTPGERGIVFSEGFEITAGTPEASGVNPTFTPPLPT